MFLAVEQSCKINYNYFTHLTFSYIPAHFVFNYLLLATSSERQSFGHASGHNSFEIGRYVALCLYTVLFGYSDGRCVSKINK